MWEFGEDIATCPSCTLRIKIVYDEDDLPELRQDGSDDEDGSVELGTKLNSMTIEVVRSATTYSESKDDGTQQNYAHQPKVVQ